jgi:hypothetical protein
MPIAAFLLLLWRRRHVLSAFRRARAAWAGRPTNGRRAGAPAAAGATMGWIALQAWRAIDTPQNAVRAERLLARMRAAAARADEHRTAAV